MFFRPRAVGASECRRPPELHRQRGDFLEPAGARTARLVSGVQSPQDAQEVAHGLERKRIRVYGWHREAELGTVLPPPAPRKTDPNPKHCRAMPRRRDDDPARRAPTPVGQLLRTSRELAPKSGRLDTEQWRRIVGERVAERTRPASIQDGTLLVYVASAVWAQELTLLSPAIVERLAKAGVPATALRFRVGDIGEREAKKPAPAPPPAAPPKARLPSDLEERLSHIGDPALRAAIAEAAAYSLGRPSETPRGHRAPRSGASRTDPTARAEPRPTSAPRGTGGKRER